MPRPDSYDAKIADEICETIATSSGGLQKVCASKPHFPTYATVCRWRDKHPDFDEKYCKAKIAQVHTIIDEIIDIADAKSDDTIIEVNDNGTMKLMCNKEWLNRSRLRIDTRKWLASKLVPKLYGDRIQHDINENKQEKFIDKISELPIAHDKTK